LQADLTPRKTNDRSRLYERLNTFQVVLLALIMAQQSSWVMGQDFPHDSSVSRPESKEGSAQHLLEQAFLGFDENYYKKNYAEYLTPKFLKQYHPDYKDKSTLEACSANPPQDTPSPSKQLHENPPPGNPHPDKQKFFSHFMECGWKLGLNPNDFFHTHLYVQNYPCVGNPFLDWLQRDVGTTDKNYGKEVIITLTSHPLRIQTTYLAIESLLRQTMKPNKVLLALAQDDFPDQKTPHQKIPHQEIPKSLELLKKRGLEIIFSNKDYKSATKLLPALKHYPNAVIVTVDDDRVYEEHLLENLWQAHLQYSRNIISPSVRKYITRTQKNVMKEGKVLKLETPLVYVDYISQVMAYDSQGFFIFEGFDGVLYPPGCLDSEVLNLEKMMALCPFADDVWFQAMAIKKGSQSRGLPADITKSLHWPREIEGTQEYGLYKKHLKANDWMVYRTFHHYGLLREAGINPITGPTCRDCLQPVTLLPSDFSLAHSDQGNFAQANRELNKGEACKTCLQSLVK